MTLHQDTLNFLKRLEKNNDREWFQSHRALYDKALVNVHQWLNELIALINRHDRLETPHAKAALYRIYNDVRFSADKSPYNARFAGNLKRTKPFLRGGYYFWIKPGASRIGCGFTYPSPPDLLRIRQDVDANADHWRKMLKSKKLQSVFGSLQGEQVRTTPKGFAKDHPAIDLLRFKQFWFDKSYSDKEVLLPTFVKTVDNDFKAIRPFFDYMTEILTTDENGESVL